MKVQKALWKSETRFTCKSWSFLCFWILIRIRIPNEDPDSRKPNECGSRWIRIRIHNTDKNRVLVIFSFLLFVSSFPLAVLVIPDAVLFLLSSVLLFLLVNFPILLSLSCSFVILWSSSSFCSSINLKWGPRRHETPFSSLIIIIQNENDIDEPAFLAGTENLPCWEKKEEKVLNLLCCNL